MSPRIQLQWVWGGPNPCWQAAVRALDHQGRGEYVLYIIQRPAYCDRGKWHVLVETRGAVDPLDSQEGFPRYFFKLENAKEEMEFWVNEREEVTAAFVAQKENPLSKALLRRRTR